MYDGLVSPEEIDNDWKEFPVIVSCSLSKKEGISTKGYIGDEIVNPKQEYYEDCFTIEDTLHFAVAAAEYFLEHKDYTIYDKKKLEQVIQSCKGWTVDDLEVIQEQI